MHGCLDGCLRAQSLALAATCESPTRLDSLSGWQTVRFLRGHARKNAMKIPDPLIQALIQQQLVPFIGSGVSLAVTAGDKTERKRLFPSWGGLLECMAEKLDESDAGIVRGHCHKRRWLKAAEAALEGLGKHSFNTVMREMFDIAQPPDADWSLPDAVWRLQPPLVVTTNYDRVLDWRKPGSRRLLNDQLAELAELYRAIDPQRPTVWHLHGHIERADSLILAPVQYDAFYAGAETAKQYAAATAQLKALLANWTLLFIGFGMQDEYVMELVADVLKTFGGATRPHFALLKAGEADTQRLWKEHNVRVIEYTDHGPPLIELLDELAAAKTVQGAAAVVGGKGQRAKEAGRSQRPIVPPAYLKWLSEQCGKDVDLSGLRPKHGLPVTLRNVYVPVTTSGGLDDNAMGQMGPMGRMKRGSPKDLREDVAAERPAHALLQPLAAEKSLSTSPARPAQEKPRSAGG